MIQVSSVQKIILFVILCLGLVIFPAAAQEAAPIPQGDQPGIYTYGCVYDEASNSVQIRADLMERDGTPMFVDGVTVGNLQLPEGAVIFQRVEPRQPVRIFAVIDTTRSYPVEPMRDTLQDAMQNFPVQDELALVTFDDRPSSLMGPPTIEKLAIIDQYRDRIVPGGDPQAGIAVLYDGILTALGQGVDPASPLRQVVLVLTDSPHRNERSDTTAQEVIERAQAVRAPIFIIAFQTLNDTPDFDILAQITNGTGGHLWSYGQEEGDDKSIATLTEEMRDFLNDFLQALSGEYLISINAETLEPNPDTLTVTMDVSVTSAGRNFSLGTFDCVLPLVNHSIAFGPNIIDNMFVSLDQQPLSLTTTVDSPLAEDEREVRLSLNDTRLLGNTISLDDTSVQGALLPVNNSLKAELLDVRNPDEEPKLLAVDEATGINFQRRLDLTVEGDPDSVSGETTFVATVDGDYAVPENRVVRFVIRSDGGEYQRLLPTSPDLIDGEGRLTITDINARVAELFGEDADNLEVLAYIDGSAADGSDALFVSEPLPITLGEIVVAPTEAAQVSTPAPTTGTAVPQVDVPAVSTPISPLIIPLAVAGGLVLVDLLLLRQIRTARVKRLIKYPDDRELPQNMLRVTVTRDGRHQMYTLTKQTMNVGRGTSNDINLSDDTNISRDHGVIMWRRGRWYYANRKPQARVQVGNKTLKGYRMQELGDNTQLKLGDYTLVSHYDTEADPDSLLKTQF
jgi:hypothetical protein